MTATGEFGLHSDLPLEVEAEMGRQAMPFRRVLGLHVGNVILLNRAVGDHLDLVVGGVPLGSGEIVVVGDRLGIRLVSLAGPPATAGAEIRSPDPDPGATQE